MKKFLITSAICLLFSASVFAQDWQWNTFSPPTAAWSIYAPGKMNPDEEAQEADSKMGSFAYSDFYGFFAVVYRDQKSSFWSVGKPDYSNYYKKVRNDFVKASKGELLKEEKYISGDRTGRDLRIKIPAGTITGLEGKTITKYRIERIRMFFVGKRFYLLLAVLPADIIDTPAIDKYFDSFEVK